MPTGRIELGMRDDDNKCYILTDVIYQNFTVSNYMYFRALLIGTNLARKISGALVINRQITTTT